MNITYEQKCIAEIVIKQNRKIADVAKQFGISKSTVRRYMDKYTEESLRVKRDESIENAYLVHIEMHVGNDTRNLHQLIYAPNKEEAVRVVAAMKPDYRGNKSPSYQLQVKGGPFKLTENLWMLEEY
jgi:hypothetical protein